jgi:hypothetical protein
MRLKHLTKSLFMHMERDFSLSLTAEAELTGAVL